VIDLSCCDDQGVRNSWRMDELTRLARTLRHMRARQIVNRVSRKLVPIPISRAPAPDLRPPTLIWRSCRGRAASMLSPTRFRFLSQAAEIVAPGDWNSERLSRLWLYNLHYFDDLRGHDAAQRSAWHRDLIERWITENPPRRGAGWEPYPTSLRIVNWIAWALAGNELRPRALHSLAVQARSLRATLEFHLLGNHLLANAKALVFAGCFFSGREADAWLRTGLDLLDAEFAEQILEDGGHFELSPMYHAIVLEDMIDLVQLCGLFPAEIGDHEPSWRKLAMRMLNWLAVMTHPDGEIAFFNDAAFGIARTHAELAEYGSWFGVLPQGDPGPVCWLPASGYAHLRTDSFSAIFDVGEIGPAYLPGHGHADVLSLEISVDGRRLVTNGGTSSYEIGPVRSGERSTAAHATVELDDRSSSETWSSFRVGRRAHPFDVRVTAHELTAAASHDGYRWLPGYPVHRRTVVVSPDVLRVVDTIAGTGDHSVVARFPLHPAVTLTGVESDGWRLELGGGRVVGVTVQGCVERSLLDGYYAPTFGQRIPRPVLAWRYRGALPLNVETRFEL
jgi:uncharacterized heparinase superfamily protein